jgi:molecular chaperone GrpE (heat shock protein)
MTKSNKTPSKDRKNHSGSKPKAALRVEKDRADKLAQVVEDSKALLQSLNTKLDKISKLETEVNQIKEDLNTIRKDFDNMMELRTEHPPEHLPDSI